jgi:hypothetical protein
MTPSPDYTGLPAWYLLDLVSDRLIKLALESGCKAAGDHELMVAGGTLVAQAGGPSKTYMNDLCHHRIGVVGLHMAELILHGVGLQIAEVRDDMFIPFQGLLPAIRMASDELYALRLPPSQKAILTRAAYLRERHKMLLSLRPKEIQ